MQLIRYEQLKDFADDTLDILLEHEVENNLTINLIFSGGVVQQDWLLASVVDQHGSIVLIAACTPPYNIMLYETPNSQNDEALDCLIGELKAMGYVPPGVLARQNLAARFAERYAGADGHSLHMSMNIMRLDGVNEIARAPGYLRLLREDDLFFVPFWERAFEEECRVLVNDIPTHVEQLKTRIDMKTHYIWENSYPVSQARHARNTQNGAVLSGVYTPPQFRGNGYATSLVAELSQILLDMGRQFVCLFADADNPISCGIYRKIGFYDICVFDEITFR
jgi:predicted GNAT family acetyltransferase